MSAILQIAALAFSKNIRAEENWSVFRWAHQPCSHIRILLGTEDITHKGDSLHHSAGEVLACVHAASLVELVHRCMQT